MKVYELIQELSRFNADTEVNFHLKADFDTDVDYDGIKDNEAIIFNPNITIELVY